MVQTGCWWFNLLDVLNGTSDGLNWVCYGLDFVFDDLNLVIDGPRWIFEALDLVIDGIHWVL